MWLPVLILVLIKKLRRKTKEKEVFASSTALGCLGRVCLTQLKLPFALAPPLEWGSWRAPLPLAV